MVGSGLVMKPGAWSDLTGKYTKAKTTNGLSPLGGTIIMCWLYCAGKWYMYEIPQIECKPALSSLKLLYSVN